MIQYCKITVCILIRYYLICMIFKKIVGPLMTKKDDGRWSLIGVISWGIRKSCNIEKLPTVYHQVATSIDWIYSHLI